MRKTLSPGTTCCSKHVNEWRLEALYALQREEFQTRSSASFVFLNYLTRTMISIRSIIMRSSTRYNLHMTSNTDEFTNIEDLTRQQIFGEFAKIQIAYKIYPILSSLAISIILIVLQQISAAVNFFNSLQVLNSSMPDNIFRLYLALLLIIIQIPSVLYVLFKIKRLRKLNLKLNKKLVRHMYLMPFILACGFALGSATLTQSISVTFSVESELLVFTAVGLLIRWLPRKPNAKLRLQRFITGNDLIFHNEAATLAKKYKVRFKYVSKFLRPMLQSQVNVAAGGVRQLIIFNTNFSSDDVNAIDAVLSHEIGHFLEKDILSKILLKFSGFFTVFAISELILRISVITHLSDTYFFPSSKELPFALFAITFSYLIYLSIFAALSRKFEYRADKFAIAEMQSRDCLMNALRSIIKDSKINYPFLYSWFLKSHPDIDDRETRAATVQLNPISTNYDRSFKYKTSRFTKILVPSLLLLIVISVTSSLLMNYSSNSSISTNYFINFVPIQTAIQNNGNIIVQSTASQSNNNLFYLGYNGALINNPITSFNGDQASLNFAQHRIAFVNQSSIANQCLNGQVRGPITIERSNVAWSIGLLGFNESPVFSRDGNTVYYDQELPGSSCHAEIFADNVTSGTNKQIMSCTAIANCVGDFNPVPSPDSKYLAFVRLIGQVDAENILVGKLEVEVLNFQTNALTTVAACTLDEVCWTGRGLTWSNSGLNLVYGMDGSLFKWNLGSDSSSLLFACQSINNCYYPVNPIFSPDDSWIAFSVISPAYSSKLYFVKDDSSEIASSSLLGSNYTVVTWQSATFTFKKASILVPSH